MLIHLFTLNNMEFNATFIVTIITFVLFVILMNKILYTPILEIMERRKSFIENNYKEAEDNKSKANELKEEKDSMLLNAKDTARDKYNQAIDGYKAQKEDIVSEANISAKEELEQSKIELEQVSNEIKNALKGSMTDLANDIVEKVIGYRSEIQDFDSDVVNKVLWDK